MPPRETRQVYFLNSAWHCCRCNIATLFIVAFKAFFTLESFSTNVSETASNSCNLPVFLWIARVNGKNPATQAANTWNNINSTQYWCNCNIIATFFIAEFWVMFTVAKSLQKHISDSNRLLCLHCLLQNCDK